MTREQQGFNDQAKEIEQFNTELERRRNLLSQIEERIRSATNREQVLEQLRRISEETRFVQQLCGFSSSLQTAASILGLVRENSRLYNLATRRLADLEHGSANSVRPDARNHRPPVPPAR